ncbi:coiled-coil domain-containing protein, partial [Tanacetum coccineum]
RAKGGGGGCYDGEGVKVVKKKRVFGNEKTKRQHLFSEIGRKVSYDVEVTAFVEEGRMRNLTGVKSKELLIWVGISDIFVSDHNNGK